MSEVLVTREGAVLTLAIDRPERRNALNAAVIDGLARGFAEGFAAPEIRVLVITGVGDKAFCAGADLAPDGARFAADQPNAPYADLLRLVRAGRKPVIARINGACMAGGFGLLCMADMAIAADHALFGLPEVKVGLFPMQVMALLRNLVPPRIVAEWALTGEPFSAAEALSAGLLNAVVPSAELDAKVAWLVGRLLDKSPMAIARGKYAMRAIEGMTTDQALAHMEAQIALAAQSADAREGLAAFAEKRQPKWAE